MTRLIYVSTSSVQGSLCFTSWPTLIPFISLMITILSGEKESLQSSFACSWRQQQWAFFSIYELAACMLLFGFLSSFEWRQISTSLWCLCKHQKCLGTLSLNGNSIFQLICYISSQFYCEIWEHMFGGTSLKHSLVNKTFSSVEERNLTWSFVVESARGTAYI